MKRISAVLVMSLLLAAASATAALGASFTIPLDTWIQASGGSTVELTTVDTPAELIGSSCTGIAVAANGESVHPNNDLIIETGTDVVILKDVESGSGKVTPAAGTVTLGPTVKVSVKLGEQGQFSGGLVITLDSNCTPATTTTTTTTPPPTPAIQIVKDANPVIYENGTGQFTITVTNPGPVDLINVVVTDVIAPTGPTTAACEHNIGDLAVGEVVSYGCSVPGLDGVSPYVNTATVVGTDRNGTQVTDTDPAEIFPVAGTTVTTSPPTTQPPTTAPPTTLAPTTTGSPTETLPVTGISTEAMRSFSVAGLGFLLIGVLMLSGAAVVGQYRSRG